ncbi:hypothetical protein HIM_01890 [Hirsutella minnesotensis 3608]|nr:hypothetical protein HIM_01890 [Hirsutella minnesotensis 3608]
MADYVHAGSAAPDRGPQVVRLVWALAPLALLTTVLRLVGRARNRVFGWDDVFMILAMLCFLGWSIVLTLYAQRGGLRHVQDVERTGADNLVEVLLLNWAGQPFAIVGVAAGKISISALILGIIDLTELRCQRIFLWAVPITITAFLAIACSILALVQCSPVEALWDDRVPGNCIEPRIVSSFGTFAGAWNTFADASLAIIPATIIWRLENTTAEKVQLTLVFGLNILTSICSGIKTQYLYELANRTDQTWATYDIFVWVTGELFLIIVCGSVPTLLVVLGWVRNAINTVKRQRSKACSIENPFEATLSDKTKSECGDNHVNFKTKTTIERVGGTKLGCANRLDADAPTHGVRVELMYDVCCVTLAQMRQS